MSYHLLKFAYSSRTHDQLSSVSFSYSWGYQSQGDEGESVTVIMSFKKNIDGKSGVQIFCT